LKLAASLDDKKGRVHVGTRSSICPGSPEFSFTDYFHGHTRASGWFSDRFGRPRRHFCGDFYGSFDDGVFVLDEKLFYTDGVKEVRQWRIRVSDEGIFTAESDSLIDGAHGFLHGDRLSMKYSMGVKVADDKQWELDMKDLMILQPDGSLHNITQVLKWGVRIGTVSTQYLQHDGDRLCVDENSSSTAVSYKRAVGRHLSSV